MHMHMHVCMHMCMHTLLHPICVGPLHPLAHARAMHMVAAHTAASASVHAWSQALQALQALQPLQASQALQALLPCGGRRYAIGR